MMIPTVSIIDLCQLDHTNVRTYVRTVQFYFQTFISDHFLPMIFFGNVQNRKKMFMNDPSDDGSTS